MNRELSKEKLIKTIEYCPIQRASEILGCSVEDIEHYMTIGTIGSYIYLDKLEFPLRYIVGEQAAEKIESKQISPGDLDLLLYGSQPAISNAADTDLSKIIYGVNYNSDFDAEFWGPDVVPFASGIWRLTHPSTIKELIKNTSAHGVYVSACKRDGSFDQPDITDIQKPEVWSRSLWVESVNKSDLYLIQSDLLKIYNALYNDQPMNADSPISQLPLLVATEPESKELKLPEYLSDIKKLLDGEHEFYAPELAIALKVWLSAINSPNPPKNNVIRILDGHIPESITADETRKRIAKVCNWNKNGNR